MRSRWIVCTRCRVSTGHWPDTGQAKIFSIMDLECGYWQIPIKKEDRVKTAFITVGGVFLFVCMPFGLCTTPSTFQRTMDLVLGGGLRWSVCLVYLDDIIVYARNTEEHRQRLVMVLSALRKVNLKLKLAKFRFAEKEITALGHRISADGVRPDPDKVKAVKEFPQLPRSGKRADLVKLEKGEELSGTGFVLSSFFSPDLRK
jgi:hypothetical protein